MCIASTLYPSFPPVHLCVGGRRELVPPSRWRTSVRRSSALSSSSWVGGTVATQRRERATKSVPRALKADDTVYQGRYGPWKVESEDVAEVTLYRSSLSLLAFAFAIGTMQAIARDRLFPEITGTAAAAMGDLALGVAVARIHVYVRPLKRFVQALWILGTLGGTWILFFSSQSHAQGAGGVASLPAYVAENPSSVWLIGCSCAALTGITFKEGICYGKPEAFLSTLLIPALCMLHLFSGTRFESLEEGLAVALSIALGIFAWRKWSQPVAEDVGDKSVFLVQDMSDREREEFFASQRMFQADRYGRIMPDEAEHVLEEKADE